MGQQTGDESEEPRVAPGARQACFDLACRFFFGALLGGVVSLVLAGAVLGLLSAGVDVLIVFTGGWRHLFWVIPLIWGVLSMLQFDLMLELASAVLNRLLGYPDELLFRKRQTRKKL